ncbi:hypothetical protein ABZ485_28170 [Streptomyces albogriseolus]|uniref:hypothetical protein n=1 Tax=Streptomyces albogriseolus TaxID=1887 RepID=UPI003461608E
MAALDEVFEDLDGFAWIPGIAQILDGARTLHTAIHAGQVDADATQTALTTIAQPNGPDLVEVLSLLVQDLTNPQTNPALAGLPDEVAKDVQLLGETHVHQTADYTPREAPNEAAGLISEHTPTSSEGRCQAVTDAEREELRRKVAEANKRSENRPR